MRVFMVFMLPITTSLLILDAALDAALDALDAALDADLDAALDADLDAALDADLDAALDAVLDADLDAALDALDAALDAALGAATTTGAETCATGATTLGFETIKSPHTLFFMAVKVSLMAACARLHFMSWHLTLFMQDRISLLQLVLRFNPQH
jgi:hypothetical protein